MNLSNNLPEIFNVSQLERVIRELLPKRDVYIKGSRYTQAFKYTRTQIETDSKGWFI